MSLQANPDLGSVVLSPAVLITFIVCALIGGLLFWLLGLRQRHQREQALAQQRVQQEATVERLLEAVAQDKEKLIADYEQRLYEREERIAALEREVGRLRDRLSSSGILSLFGGRQREVVSALLLENEQLHEMLAAKQADLRELMADMSSKILARMDEQAQESARAVRYKQALLSAFLQHEEARRLLDNLVAEGRVGPGPSLAAGPAPSETE